MTVLALATLGGTTQKDHFYFLPHHPRWPRQVQSHVAIDINVCVGVAGVIALNSANVNIALSCNPALIIMCYKVLQSGRFLPYS
jgi:hypothetical protein